MAAVTTATTTLAAEAAATGRITEAEGLAASAAIELPPRRLLPTVSLQKKFIQRPDVIHSSEN
jgi:hypothetical protein